MTMSFVFSKNGMKHRAESIKKSPSYAPDFERKPIRIFQGDVKKIFQPTDLDPNLFFNQNIYFLGLSTYFMVASNNCMK